MFWRIIMLNIISYFSTHQNAFSRKLFNTIKSFRREKLNLNIKDVLRCEAKAYYYRTKNCGKTQSRI